MPESIVKEIITDLEHIRELYLKVVLSPNKSRMRKGFIKCPECGEQILMIPVLKKMNEAIENHVKVHKAQPEVNSLLNHHTAMQIRLDLAQQVLQQASSPFLL